eukprot:1793613-Pleurochrysis_carterae.AAC.2
MLERRTLRTHAPNADAEPVAAAAAESQLPLAQMDGPHAQLRVIQASHCVCRNAAHHNLLCGDGSVVLEPGDRKAAGWYAQHVCKFSDRAQRVPALLAKHKLDENARGVVLICAQTSSDGGRHNKSSQVRELERMLSTLF